VPSGTSGSGELRIPRQLDPLEIITAHVGLAVFRRRISVEIGIDGAVSLFAKLSLSTNKPAG
jgi:hypothetical protein